MNFQNLKAIFATREEFEHVKFIAEMFNAQTITWEEKNGNRH